MSLTRFTNLAIATVLVANSGGLTAAAVADDAAPPLPSRVVDLEFQAVALIREAAPVPLDDAGTPCEAARLRVAWTEPGPWYEVGAFVSPIGPPPTTATTRVNGVVICEGSSYAYMGFEAVRVKGVWLIEVTPAFAEAEGHGVRNMDADLGAFAEPLSDAPPVAPVASGLPSPTPSLLDPAASLATGREIDGYAPYEPQRTCDANAKPGVLGFRDLAISKYPGSRNLGIVRGCSVGGNSEHKEGRAFDWGVRVDRPGEKAAAEEMVNGLLATDAHGNKHALARRLGVMYVIWNRQIWSSHRHSEGWRPYHGASAHTDHVHVSFSWAGARAQTSYWSGKPVPTGIDESTPSPFAGSEAGGGGGGGATSAAPRPKPQATPEELAAREIEKQRRREEEARIAAEKAAARQARRDEEARVKAERRAAEAAKEEERQARKRAERERRSTSTTRPKTTTTRRPKATTTTRPKTTTTKPKTTTTTRPRRSTTTTTTKPVTTTTKPVTTTSSAPPTTTTQPPTTTTQPPPPTTTAPTTTPTTAPPTSSSMPSGP